MVQPPELCDQGDQNGAWALLPGDSCNDTCDGLGPHCGDDEVNGPEECEDANHDGHDACTNACTIQSCGDEIVTPGELCFEPPVIRDAWIDATAVAVGDFDEDGHLDVVVADRGDAKLYRMLGDGDGGLGSPTAFETVTGVRTIAPANFDTDDHLDLVALGDFDAGWHVSLGDGAGDFSPLPGPAMDVIGLGVGDLDGNARGDLVLGTPAGIEVWLDDGDGTFTSHASHPVDGHDGDASIVVDLDGDTLADVVSLLDEEGDSPPGQVRTWTGAGTGNLAPGQTFPLMDDGDALLTADFDNDAVPDVAALRGSQECFSMGGGCGQAGPPTPFHPTMGEVNVFRGLGGGLLDDPSSHVHGTNPTAFAAGDLDADQNTDILVGYDSFRFASFLRGDGAGDFTLTDPFDIRFRVTDIALADLDEDGLLDILLTRGGLDDVPGELWVFSSDP